MISEPLLTLRDLSQRLGVSERTLERIRDAHPDFPIWHLSQRHRRYSEADVRAFLRNLKPEGD